MCLVSVTILKYGTDVNVSEIFKYSRVCYTMVILGAEIFKRGPWKKLLKALQFHNNIESLS